MWDRISKGTDTFRELFVLYGLVIVIAASIFSVAEGKALWDSMWWAMVTAMTVGYGDIYPVTVVGRMVGVVLFHFVPLFLIPILVVRMMSKVVQDNNAFTDVEQEELKREIKGLGEQVADIKGLLMDNVK